MRECLRRSNQRLQPSAAEEENEPPRLNRGSLDVTSATPRLVSPLRVETELPIAGLGAERVIGSRRYNRAWSRGSSLIHRPTSRTSTATM